MANGNGATDGNAGGNQSSVGGSIQGDDGIIRIDPAAVDAAAGTVAPNVGNTKPGYGPNGRKLNKDGTERKAKGTGGNAPASTQAAPPLSIDAATFSLVGIHAMLATVLGIKELALDPTEGKQMALALQNLQRFYNIQVTEKALAWSNMGMTLMAVYGTRAAAFAARKAAEAKTNPRTSGTVIRPQQFQARPTVVEPAVMSPDGDPAQAAPVGVKPGTNGEAAFASTPPEFM